MGWNLKMFKRFVIAFGLCSFAIGCETQTQTANAPVPPEDDGIEATAPDGSARDEKAPDQYQVALDTTEGRVVIQVERSMSPRGADRFYRLVKEGFYDGAKFFRVVEEFVVQFGMAADPQVNAAWKDRVIRDDPVKGTNAPGTVTFATSGPNSRTTQIFINLGDNAGLDGQGFSPFGRVVEGMDVVRKFYSGYGEAPQQPSIDARGNEYLNEEFPELDAIKEARVVSENGAAVNERASENAAAAVDSIDAAEEPASATQPE